GGPQLEEWRRRLRHSKTLKVAVRLELERIERVLVTYVYLWDHESHPTEVVIKLRRLVASSGLWGDDDPELVEAITASDAHLPGSVKFEFPILRHRAPRGKPTP